MVDLIGLANALTDLTFDVTDEEVERIKAVKGFHRSEPEVDSAELHKVAGSKKKLVSQGGAPTNVVFGARKLGLKAGLFATLGPDEYGKAYIDYLEKAGIKSFVETAKGPSGVCYVMITPDKERAVVSNLGVSVTHDYDLSNLDGAKMLFTSGYEIIANPRNVMNVLRNAKEKGLKLSLDMADPGIIEPVREQLAEVIKELDVLFVTEEEAEAYVKKRPYEALEELGKACPVVVLKKGAKGSVVRHDGVNYDIPVVPPAKLVNTNGAGDAYAAGFLTGFINRMPVQRCGELGAQNASKVCEREEAHL
ncbi:adenosine kinase [Candidatus Woesearchaeota archaeon]|nr:adenosine kinase [Candidatus Woesearchaeota archaeon]